MSYQVLARKLRPADFEGLIGQEHVVRALVHALDHNRVHHAYLFTGTRGVGKTTIARVLAKALNCEQGVTATPCGVCGSCREIAEGRFPDLIEVDAASRTGVDATRDLLDNAQYMPTRGRYKVYLIDEVHMLSQASFNALLKTLEEPPEHVKFLLATTDPKKVPVTVLSRCLQFQLKNLLPERIAGYLAQVLTGEGVTFDEAALRQIARAARGSMRDALSLTDQAIAYGGGSLKADEVGVMLGTVNRDELGELLELIVAGNGTALLDQCRTLANQAADFVELLRGLLVALHDVAVAQTIGGAGAHDEPFVARLAQQMSPEATQLYYQIVLLGLRDLHLAPDPQCGFEMVMMRLLAFEPLTADGGGDALDTTQEPPGATGKRGRSDTGGSRATMRSARPAGDPALVSSDDPAIAATGRAWHEVVASLALSGVSRMLVEHTVPSCSDGDRWELCLDRAHDTLLGDAQVEAIGRALGEHLRRAVTVRIVPGSPASETPAARTVREAEEQRARALAVLREDRHIRTLIDEFDAELNLDSVRQVQSRG
jgi:DNA polymerase III subunit gamma/tau